MTLQIEQTVVVVGAINLVAIGAAWGHLSTSHSRIREDLQEVKKMCGLSNGHASPFVRHEVHEALVDRVSRLEKP